MRKNTIPKSIALVLVLFYVTSSLCHSQELSQPIHQVIEELAVKVSMRDGGDQAVNKHLPP
jgi:hypothetical protein